MILYRIWFLNENSFKLIGNLYMKGIVRDIPTTNLHDINNDTWRYFLDVSADYILLHESHQCDPNSTFIDYSNSSSKCFNGTKFSDDDSRKFCGNTVGNFQYYFEYTLIVCLIPLLLNSMLVVIDVRKNAKESLMWLPNNILLNHSVHEDHPFLYRILSFIHWTIWAPFLIVLYPIATKLAYIRTK